MEFIPERWLVEPGDPLYPVKGGWRPFEHGPLNCLGQTLAMLCENHAGAYCAKVKRVNSERAYQTQSGGAHPADGYPCRISFRK
ncbi:hypothetical protein F5Y00DRAFT_262580 [Daldinia vernicosa]|uniref:uncharacterized protein n=1 Tax=Daldinia vernicosa TaxID=114800 RepID=UPI00200758C5|nr:uncharacterized protein F5Y00DRAFT_262580 [Daldinia vernicosa]KAI0848484.1 hypothetical protein F5Y00DRAFT_262580 [Daldinia vernicosa]